MTTAVFCTNSIREMLVPKIFNCNSHQDFLKNFTKRAIEKAHVLNILTCIKVIKTLQAQLKLLRFDSIAVRTKYNNTRNTRHFNNSGLFILKVFL